MVNLIKTFFNWYFKRSLSGRLAIIFAFGAVSSGLGVFSYFINYLLKLANFPILPIQETDYILFFSCVFISVVFFIVNFYQTKNVNVEEFIGVRHRNLKVFGTSAIKDERNFFHNLLVYREVDLDFKDQLLNSETSIIHIRKTEDVKVKLEAFLEINNNSKIGYYGVAYIPFSFYIGYIFSDFKQNIEIFELDNQSNKWNKLTDKKTKNTIYSDIDNMQESDLFGSVILKIESSYKIKDNFIDDLNIENKHTFTIQHSRISENNISTYAEILMFQREFRKFLDLLKTRMPNITKIHLFSSISNSLSFSLGRIIKQNIDQEFIVYNYDNKENIKYSWALSFNGADNKCRYIKNGDAKC